MKYSAYSNVGGRDNNEDFFEITEMNGCYLFVLADGLGGVEAGEVASKNAVLEIKNQFLFDPKGFDLRQAVEAANEQILYLQRESGKKMKTTITAVYVADSEVYCAHIGDSRIYLFDENEIYYQSVDHSASQMAVFAGEISASQIRTHSDRNVLTSALGAGDNIPLAVKKFSQDELKAILMCSDGFWEYVFEEEMVSLLNEYNDPEAWLQEMRNLLSQRISKKNDNNTAIAVIL